MPAVVSGLPLSANDVAPHLAVRAVVYRFQLASFHIARFCPTECEFGSSLYEPAAAEYGPRSIGEALPNWQAFMHHDCMNELISYRGYRYPPEVINYPVWLYYRFTLSFRDIEDLLAERGVMVSYESIAARFNPMSYHNGSCGGMTMASPPSGSPVTGSRTRRSRSSPGCSKQVLPWIFTVCPSCSAVFLVAPDKAQRNTRWCALRRPGRAGPLPFATGIAGIDIPWGEAAIAYLSSLAAREPAFSPGKDIPWGMGSHVRLRDHPELLRLLPSVEKSPRSRNGHTAEP